MSKSPKSPKSPSSSSLAGLTNEELQKLKDTVFNEDVEEGDDLESTDTERKTSVVKFEDEFPHLI